MPIVIGALTVALLLSIILSVGAGAVHVSIHSLFQALLRPSAAGEVGTVVFMLRLPRVLAAGLVGMALSVTGVLFQGLFRNPLADPFVLGASGGAALGGAIGIFIVPTLSVAGFSATAALAFCGALITMTVVWSLARVGNERAIENMLLAGFAVGAMLNAATVLLELKEEASSPGLRILAAWLHGQVNVPGWGQILIVFAIEVVAILFALPLARRLNTLALGEEYAEQLGVHVAELRTLTLAIGAMLTALAVSLAGMIGFVGLLIPHFFRKFVGPDHSRLLPTSALGGATFLIVADTFARSALAPMEVPVGALTAFLGGPAFLYMLQRRRDTL